MSSLYQEVLLMAKREGDHLLWRSNNNSIHRNNRVYNVRRVLMRDNEDSTNVYKAVCEVRGCILPAHLTLVGKGALSKHTHCTFCGRRIRPWGVKKAEAPGTLASAGSGLCSSCYKAGYGYIGADYDIEPLNETQRAVVRRTVPRDLWSYFDV